MCNTGAFFRTLPTNTAKHFGSGPWAPKATHEGVCERSGPDQALTTVANHEYWLEFTLVSALKENKRRLTGSTFSKYIGTLGPRSVPRKRCDRER